MDVDAWNINNNTDENNDQNCFLCMKIIRENIFAQITFSKISCSIIMCNMSIYEENISLYLLILIK